MKCEKCGEIIKAEYTGWRYGWKTQCGCDLAKKILEILKKK
jgi:hypothetical protein